MGAGRGRGCPERGLCFGRALGHHWKATANQFAIVYGERFIPVTAR